jgi:hypothetical protein
MALVLNDRVQQTGTANTTVSFTLSGSVTGFQSFTAGVGNSNTTYYSAFDTSGNWEVGLGTYTTSGTLLTRTTVLASSNSGSAVTFSGTVNVFVTYPAEKAVYQDASSNVTVSGTMTASSFIASSDERLKDKWADLPVDFVSLLSQIKHGTYERISSGNREVGVTAQSLQTIIPEAVIADEAGLLSVNYGAAALVSAIELAKTVEELKAEIKELKRGR